MAAIANANVDIQWDQHALELYLLNVEENVLRELTEETEVLAREICPVRVRRTAVPRWAKRGYVGMPGRLKNSVGSVVDRDFEGLYGDIYALWYGRFLDPPAKQMHGVHPFLPTALFTVVEGRNLYL